MSRRRARQLAWSSLGLTALFFLGGLIFEWLIAGGPTDLRSTTGDYLLFAGVLGFSLVGVVIAPREPRNAIGWILLGIGLMWQLGGFVESYATYGLESRPGSVPRPELVVSLTSWWWIPAVGLMGTFLILLFPDGQLPSRRWRIWAWLSAITLVGLSGVTVVLPGPMTNAGFRDVSNPLGVEALRPFLGAIDASVSLLIVCMIGCAISLVLRFRRSRGEERLQLKWLTAGATVAATAYASLIGAAAYRSITDTALTPVWRTVLEATTFISFTLIPVAIGVAILRYRLYDIDLLINRTLVYGALSVALAGVYTLCVVAIPQALGSGSDSELVVAGSTLAVAALFQPFRRRIQGFIDRRFYRHKYDATRTAESFSARLREEVDLESMRGDLLAAVNDTMQPRRVSLWLKG